MSDKIKKYLLLFYFIFFVFIKSETIEVKRITPSREIADFVLNTPNAHLPYFPYSITEGHGKIFIGGDFSYIIGIDKNTWKINKFIGGDWYNRVTLIAGSRNKCKIPDGITDMRFDAVNNRLWMSSWFYHNIMYYDFRKDYFDNFSGKLNTPGSIRGKGNKARYNYISYIAVSTDGKYLYVCDKKNQIIVKVDIHTSISSILAGTDGIAGYVDGSCLTTNVKMSFPDGICVNSKGDKIYIYDNESIRVIEPEKDKCYTLFKIGAGFKSLVIDSNEKYFYTCNPLMGKVIRVRLKDGLIENFTDGGNGDNYNYPKFEVHRKYAKFRAPDNLEIKDDFLYVCDTKSLQLKTINLKSNMVNRLLGFSWWAGNYQPASFTGWAEITGFDFFGNTLIVSTGKQKMICKIYENGIKEDVAGHISKEEQNYKDGYKDESICLNPFSGVVLYKDGEPWYFFKDKASIRGVNLITNYLKTFIGDPNLPGCIDGINNKARLSSGSAQLAGWNNYIYITEKENNIIRRFDINKLEIKTICGKYKKMADLDSCNNLKNCLLGLPSGIWIDPKSNGNLIYFWDNAYGKCKVLDLKLNKMKTVFKGGGNVNSIAGRYYNDEKILFFYNNNNKNHISIFAYNEKYNSIEKIIGFSDNILFIGDRDGLANMATLDYFNFSMKWFENKKILMFDTFPTFNNLRYIEFK